ncbi:4Fe-4S dicluster domain-containing protein [Chloroflexota bacterium]
MVIDLKKCIGCNTCVLACKAEHNTPPRIFWTKVLEKEEGRFPSVKKTFFPILCYHCKEAPCVDICPTGATTKREDGIVTIDYDVCIGCRACMIACPYQNRYFWGSKDTMYFTESHIPYGGTGSQFQEYQRATVQKCNFCHERVERGLEPACVAACPADARTFGDLDDSYSEVSRLTKERDGFQIQPELLTDPSVYYVR